MELVDPLLGKQLGNYLLDQRLGHGSCGVVYRCEHVKLKTPFAIKILHPILASNEESAARFLREARTAARIQHENVVFIADFDVEPSVGPYFVMEFLDGASLREVMDQEGPFDAPRIANLCEQICGALASAHEAGVIHRDLKPENICILPRPKKELVKILDFGIAKISRDAQSETRELTQRGRVLGTPRYFSPEQAQGAEIDRRSDIYAFGIILYEMLVGEPPFMGQTPEELVLYHLTLPPPRLDPERFPPELQDLVDWLLAKRPNERPDNMEEVWALLDEALHQMSIQNGQVYPSHSSAFLPAIPPKVNNIRRPPSPIVHTEGYSEELSFAARAALALPEPRGTSSGSAQLVDVLVDVLDQKAPAATPSAESLAQAIKEALERSTDLHINQPPHVLRDAIKEALDKETTLSHKQPPDELIDALEQVLSDNSVDIRPHLHEEDDEEDKTSIVKHSGFTNDHAPTRIARPPSHPPEEEGIFDETVAIDQVPVILPPTEEPPPSNGSSPGHSSAYTTEHADEFDPTVAKDLHQQYDIDPTAAPAQQHPVPASLDPDAIDVIVRNQEPKEEVDDLLDASLVSMAPPQSRLQRFFGAFFSVLFHPATILIILGGLGVALAMGYNPFASPTNTPDETTPPVVQPKKCIGSVKLSTVPPSIVYLDGQKLGITPYTHKAKCNTELTFTFRAKRHHAIKRTIQITKEEREFTYTLQYKPPREVIWLKSIPSRAYVYFKSRRVCRTPCKRRIPYRLHRVYYIRKRGYLLKKLIFRAGKERNHVTVRLRRRKRRRRRRR